MVNRIVAIDDEVEYLNLISEFSAMTLCDCITFAHWSQDIVNHIDGSTLLFLDIHMPSRDGIDILMELSRLSFKGGIVVLSGAEEGVVSSVLKLGASLDLNMFGHLKKPFMLRAFREVISKFENENQPPEFLKNNQQSLEIGVDGVAEYFDNGWFFPVYQPQFDPSTNIMVGMECLARMNHPVYGEVAPPRFIEYLVENNLIGEFTERLVAVAFDQCSKLLIEHPQLNIAFNISSLSLSQEFTSRFLNLVEESGLLPKQVTIEITETRAISLSKDALYSVSKYRASGFNLSVDDFGTGYSTILQLNDLPFNELKIDRSFISKITESEKSLKIVEATLMMASSLSMDVVAEGVETEEQLRLITQMGCHRVQGYIFSKPLLIEPFLTFTKEKLT